MDYKELVKSLRICAGGGGCTGCNQHPCSSSLCFNRLESQAADAIEELIAALTASNEVIAKSKPKWIPVTERLPDSMRDVQITVFWHDAWRTMYGYYDGAFWHLYAPMDTKVPDVEVIGWMEKPSPMPLPEPPKEDE